MTRDAGGRASGRASPSPLEPDRPSAPLVLAAAAPLTVVVTLGLLGSVLWTFALYHLAICLVLPAVDSLVRRGIAPADHLRLLGATGPRARGGIVVGLALAPVFAAASLGALALARAWLPPSERIAAVLQSWGATPARLPVLTALFAAGNGPAEELFWRGWVQGRLRQRWGPAAAVGLAAAFYCAYHAYTLTRLLGAAAPGLVVIGGVLLVAAAGAVWGWLREVTGSVWPAVIGHTAATAAYVAGYWVWLAPGAAAGR